MVGSWGFGFPLVCSDFLSQQRFSEWYKGEVKLAWGKLPAAAAAAEHLRAPAAPAFNRPEGIAAFKLLKVREKRREKKENEGQLEVAD